jgi:geranylgeranyl pyrophosphate synthase
VALRLGALLGGAEAETHEVLAKYSESLGIAYQIRDDLEDCTGGGDSDDLAGGRLSLVLAIGFKRAEDAGDREALRALFARGGAASREEALRLLRECRALEKGEELLEAYKEDAIRSLRFLSNPTLKGLLRRVVGKIFGEHLIEGYCSEFEARNAASRAAGAEPPAGSQ